MSKAIITVVGKDTVGIIAKVCTYLAENHVNILDISQTIVQGYFNMMMIVDVSAIEKTFGEVADELEKELTVAPSQKEKTQAAGTILEFVNSKIISGSWPSGEEQTFSLDSSALNQSNELSAQVKLSWEEGENGCTDASLYVTVHCIYHDMPFSVTTIYNAYTAYTADDENQNEDVQDTLYWIRSERR